MVFCGSAGSGEKGFSTQTPEFFISGEPFLAESNRSITLQGQK